MPKNIISKKQIKAEEFVDEIFWVDILSRINIESKEAEQYDNIIIDDRVWYIYKHYLPKRWEGEQDLLEIRLRCSNSKFISNKPISLYNKNLVRKSCWGYLEGTNNPVNGSKKKNYVNRNGFDFDCFEIKQPKQNN
jgi:hypothetical protein